MLASIAIKCDSKVLWWSFVDDSEFNYFSGAILGNMSSIQTSFLDHEDESKTSSFHFMVISTCFKRLSSFWL
jgi:hypothetical protein